MELLPLPPTFTIIPTFREVVEDKSEDDSEESSSEDDFEETESDHGDSPAPTSLPPFTLANDTT